MNKLLLICLFEMLTISIFAAERVTLQSYQYPPYMTGNAEKMGMGEEILCEILRNSKYEFNIEISPSKRSKENFEKDVNSILLIGEPSFITEYEKKGYSDMKVIKFRFAYLIKSETPNIVKIEDLKQYTVGELLGAAYTKKLELYVKSVEEVETHEQNIKKLYMNRIDAMHAIDFTLMEMVNQFYPNEKEKFKISTYGEYSCAVVIVHDKKKELLKFMKKRFKEMIKSKKYEKIISKYYKNGIPKEILINIDDVQ